MAQDLQQVIVQLGATQIQGGISAVYYKDNLSNYNGTFGKGGNSYRSDTPAGGGGYYGGATGGYDPWIVYQSTGGSSYISGYEGCNSISEKSTENNIIHTGNIVHYSNKYFIFAEMQSGASLMPTHDGTNQMTGNSGNGYAKITRVDVN